MDSIETTKDDSAYIAQVPNKYYGEVLDLMERMTQHHREGK